MSFFKKKDIPKNSLVKQMKGYAVTMLREPGGAVYSLDAKGYQEALAISNFILLGHIDRARYTKILLPARVDQKQQPRSGYS